VLSFFTEAFGELAAGILVPALLLLLLLLLATPIYLVMKRLSPTGRNTTFKQDLLEAFTARPKQFSELPPERQRLLRGLNAFDLGLSTFYEYFLYAVMVLATVFAAYLYFAFKKDASRDFLTVYFGVGYVVLMIFLAGQVSIARARQRRAKSPDSLSEPVEPDDSLISALSSVIQAKVQNVEEVHKVDAAALDAIRSALALRGTTAR